jgi:hypothetical protein
VRVGGTLTGVQYTSTVQVWLGGGPADGSIRSVQCAPDGRPPHLLMLGGGGRLFVGASDEPVAPEHAVYEIEPDAAPAESLWPYRSIEKLPAG